MPRHIEVSMEDFRSVTSPHSLETCGLATCIGVAIIHDKRGFVMHASSVVMDPSSVAKPFFALLDKHIPASARRKTVPVVAGGSVGRSTKDPLDEETRASVRADRTEILRLLKEAGFAPPEERWAGPCETHSLFLDPGKRIIELATEDTLDRDSQPEVEQFRG